MVRSFAFELTAEMSVFTQISVIQVTGDGRVSVSKNAGYSPSPLWEGGYYALPCAKRRGGERELTVKDGKIALEIPAKKILTIELT